jgi:hypothetical protein
MNMVHVQLNTQRDCRAGTAGTALEIVPLEYSPSQTQRWISAGFVPIVRTSFNLTLRKFSRGSVGVINESPQRFHP